MLRVDEINRKIVLAFCGLSLVACANQSFTISKPKLQCDTVVFSNKNIVHLDDIADGDCISEDNFRIVESWARVIIIRNKPLSEDSVTHIEVYDYDGALLNKSKGFIGKVLILIDSNKILLGSMSIHFSAKESYLLDKDGRHVKNFSQPENVFDIKKSDDDKLIWLLSQSISEGRPYVRLTLLNKDANAIETKDFYDAEMYIKIYEGTEYKISIPEPLIPG